MPSSPLTPQPPPPQNRTSSSHPPAPRHLSWTVEREARLVYVQKQLTAAQAAWSEEQDLWIDEVHQLENLKRKCLKAEKKEATTAKRRANSVAAIWKAKTWGSSKSKTANNAEEALGESSGTAFVDGPESMENDGADDMEGDGEEESASRNKSLTSLFRTISRRNTVDGGQASRLPSLPAATPEQSYLSTEVKAKRKANVLQKRRDDGR
ncbi:MAG: hypothetical protein Q9171_004037 [Xanthocarpia ochracea]